jgi:hypothetical protein
MNVKSGSTAKHSKAAPMICMARTWDLTVGFTGAKGLLKNRLTNDPDVSR